MINIARTYARMVWMAGFLLAFGTSCSRDMNETPARTVSQVTVSIASQSNLQTRTGLPVHNGEVDADWVQGVQHVTDVYLYVFEQDEDKKDFTCRSMYDVRWSESVDREDGKLPTTTSSINYTINYNFVVGKTYRLVAVGLDCAENVDEMQDFDGHNSALTYGLPESIQPGNKLSQAIATLQVGKTTEDIMHSEFFVGEIGFSPSSYESGNIGTVELFRRVAGLQVCLDGIPEEVEQIRVLLYNSQNTQTYLLKNNPNDFITSPYNGDIHDEEGRVLLDIEKDQFQTSVPGTDIADGSTTYKCGGTAYLLPIGKPDKERYDYTFMVEFITTGITGIVGESKKVRLTRPYQDDQLQFEDEYDIGTGIIDDLNKYLFPIEANHFYCLGKPSKPIDCSQVFQ